MSDAASSLFGDLPTFPAALPDDELRLLAKLPVYGGEDVQMVAQVDEPDEAAAGRLERRGLIKVHRWKDDPAAIQRTMYAGKLRASIPALVDQPTEKGA